MAATTISVKIDAQLRRLLAIAEGRDEVVELLRRALLEGPSDESLEASGTLLLRLTFAAEPVN